MYRLIVFYSEAAIKNYATECREIVVRFNEQFVHVILSPKSSTSPDAINPAVCKHLIRLSNHSLKRTTTAAQKQI